MNSKFQLNSSKHSILRIALLLLIFASQHFDAKSQCPVPLGLGISNITQNGAQVNCNSVVGAVSYTFRITLLPGGSVINYATVTPLKNFTGLLSGSEYEVCVRANCGGSNVSAFTCDTFTTLSPPCNGTPNPGNILSSSNPVCVADSFTLSLQNPTIGSGVTYQWQSSPDGTSYTNYPGGTVASIRVPAEWEGGAGYYQCIVTCTASGLSATSNPIQMALNNFSNCYCTSVPTSIDGNGITDVQVGSWSNPNISTTTYQNFTSLTPLDLLQGSNNSVTVHLQTGYTYRVHAFIDYNQDGDFADVGEDSDLGLSTNVNPTTLSGNIVVPITALAGLTGMRIVATDNDNNASSCYNGTYGNVEDYKVNIVIINSTACGGWYNVGSPGISANSGGSNYGYPITSLSFEGITPYVSFQNPPSGGISVKKFNGSNWASVGSAQFSASGGYCYQHCLTFVGPTPYVAFQEDNAGQNFVRVMKFDGINWVEVGSTGMNSACVYYGISLAVDGNDLYLACTNTDVNGCRANVLKFDGTNWNNLGSSQFSGPSPFFLQLAFNASTPYVVFQDVFGGALGVSVMKYDGTNWVYVGSPGFSGGVASFTRIAFEGNTPYVVYQDGSNGDKCTVKKFNGTNWINVGNAGFSSGAVAFTKIAFDGTMPYVAYHDGTGTVMKFDGVNWLNVGSSGNQPSGGSGISLVINGSVPYISFYDPTQNGEVTVMKFLPQSSVTNLSANFNIGSTYSATATWDAIPNTPSYQFKFKPLDGNSWSNGTSVTNNKTITGLQPCTTYEFCVRIPCPGNTYSAWVCDTFTTGGMITNQIDTIVCSSFYWDSTSTTYNASGFYTHSYTEPSGCIHVTNLNLIINPTPILTVTPFDPQCTAGLGSFTFMPTSGNAPFAIDVNNGAWQFTGVTMGGLSTFQLFPAGSYTNTITDANGCSSTTNASLYDPGVIAFSGSTSFDCQTQTGSHTIQISGGVSPYSLQYAGNSNFIFANAFNSVTTPLPIDNYTVTITDANGCTVTTEIVIQGIGNTITENVTVCNFYDWNCNNISQSLVTSGTYTCITGCDTYILNLTIDPYYNTCTPTDSIIINTGYNHVTNAIAGGNGTQDPKWFVSEPNSSIFSPALLYNYASWGANNPNSSFINNNGIDPSLTGIRTYRRNFKTCKDDSLTFELNLAYDNSIEGIYVDGQLITNPITVLGQSTASTNFHSFHNYTYNHFLIGGEHTLDIKVWNQDGWYGVPGDTTAFGTPHGLNAFGTISSTNNAITSNTASPNCCCNPCPTPTNLIVTFNSTTTGLASWDPIGGIVNYNYRYRPVGGTAWVSGNFTTNNITITGLQQFTNYEFCVRALCPGNGFSNWVCYTFSPSPPPSSCNALDFDGVNDFVILNTLASPLANSTDFTIEFWMKANYNDNTTSPHVNLFAINPAAPNDNKFSIIMESTAGKLVIYEAGYITPFLTSTSTIGDNICHHIAYVRTGSLGEAFIDGLSIGTLNVGNALAINDRISLGQEYDNLATSDFYNGEMDELRVWNIARTQAQIAANMKSVPSNLLGLLAYYKFNQGVPSGNNLNVTSLLDATVYNHNGTLLNFGLNGNSSNWILESCTKYDTINKSECSVYIWPNTSLTYNQSGFYYDTLTNSNGCDSIVVLNLTIINPGFSNEYIDTCESYTWPLNGQTYTASGIYISLEPCFTHYLHLTILPPPSMNVYLNQPDCSTIYGGIQVVPFGTTSPYTIRIENNLSVDTTFTFGDFPQNKLYPSSIYTITVTDANGCTKTSTISINTPPDQLNISANVSCSNGIKTMHISISGSTSPYTLKIQSPSFNSGNIPISVTAPFNYDYIMPAWDNYTITVCNSLNCCKSISPLFLHSAVSLEIRDEACRNKTAPFYLNGSPSGGIYSSPNCPSCVSPDGLFTPSNAGQGTIGLPNEDKYQYIIIEYKLPCDILSRVIKLKECVIGDCPPGSPNNGNGACNYCPYGYTLGDNILQNSIFDPIDNVYPTTINSMYPWQTEVNWANRRKGAKNSVVGFPNQWFLTYDASLNSGRLKKKKNPLKSIKGADYNANNQWDYFLLVNNPRRRFGKKVFTKNIVGQMVTVEENSFYTICLDLHTDIKVHKNNNNNPWLRCKFNSNLIPLMDFGKVPNSNDAWMGYGGLLTNGTAKTSIINIEAYNLHKFLNNKDGIYGIDKFKLLKCVRNVDIDLGGGILQLSNISSLVGFNQTCHLNAKISKNFCNVTYNWQPGNLTDATIAISPIVNTVYTLTVSDANGIIGTKTHEVIVKPITHTVENVSYNGLSNGRATLHTYYGTTPYQYVWSNGDTTETASNLIAGIYTVTVVDANIISHTQTVEITQPDALVLGHSIQKPCTGLSTGNISINSLSGGTMPYTVAWSTGDSSMSIENLGSGTYSVTITDNLGYSLTQSFVVADTICLGLCDSNSALSYKYFNVFDDNLTFISELVNDTTCSAGSYGIVSNVQNKCGTWDSLSNPENESGKIMVVQGASVANKKVFTTNINVIAGEKYLIETVVHPQLDTTLTTPGFDFNMGNSNVLAHTACCWPEGTDLLMQEFVATTTGSIDFSLIQTNTGGAYAIDGFAISTCKPNAPPTITYTVNPICSTSSSDSILINIVGDFGPYEVYWLNDSSNENPRSGLPLGSYPFEVYDIHGNVYDDTLIIPLDTNCVSISPNIYTIAGNGNAGNTNIPGLATFATMNTPVGLDYIKAQDAIVFVDYNNHSIRKIDSNGIITTLAGNGIAGFSGDGGPSALAQLYYPLGLTCDSIGNIFFVDQSNNRIRKIDVNGIITTLAGNGLTGYDGEGILATSSKLNVPFAVAIDNVNNIYFTDYWNYRIRKVDAQTGMITTIAGNGNVGFSGDGGLAINAEIGQPFGITVDKNGIVYFSDYTGNRIRRIDNSGIITTIAGTGIGGYNGDNIQANTAQLYGPYGLKVSEDGSLIIAEVSSHRIRKINTAGIISTIAGNGIATFNGDSIPATQASLVNPYGIAFNNKNELLLSDGANHRIRRIGTPDVQTKTTLFVKAFIQGMYIGNSIMTTALLNSGISAEINATDSITIELHDIIAPYSLAYSSKQVMYTNGNAIATFPLTVQGDYYVVLKHRNCIETWSSSPKHIEICPPYCGSNFYDFAIASSQAYGANQVEVEPGIYAIYSGDINQDGIIDNGDYTIWESDANNFASGYLATDLNGDGAVDNGDYIFWELNSIGFVGVVKP